MKVRVIQTINSDAGDFIIEEGYENWESHFRMRFEDRITEWGMYSDTLMIGDHIAVSPYYTEFDHWILCTPFEACQYLCTQEKKDENVHADSNDAG